MGNLCYDPLFSTSSFPISRTQVNKLFPLLQFFKLENNILFNMPIPSFHDGRTKSHKLSRRPRPRHLFNPNVTTVRRLHRAQLARTSVWKEVLPTSKERQQQEQVHKNKNKNNNNALTTMLRRQNPRRTCPREMGEFTSWRQDSPDQNNDRFDAFHSVHEPTMFMSSTAGHLARRIPCFQSTKQQEMERQEMDKGYGVGK